MGKKYIIELEREETAYKTVNSNGTPLIQLLAPTPYTEPDLEQVRMEAYEDGYKTAKVQCNIQAEKDLREVGERHYQKGLSDAWEAARQIIHMPEGDLLNVFTECYSAVCTALQVILKYDASEAIAKIKKYEDGKQKINVGDEVGYYGVADEHGNVCYSGVVLEIREDDYLVMEKTGKTYALKKKLVMSKTDRHFPEIASVLDKMREGQDE